MKTDIEYINCNICGQDKTELLFAVKECTGLYNESFNVVRCQNCGLVYVNPRPKKEELRKYYPENYYAYVNNIDNKESFRKKVKNYLIEIAGGYRKVKIIGGIIKKLSKIILLGVVPLKKNGKLLDVGCGNGDFLEWHKDHGWDVYGIEINQNAVNICRRKGLKVIHGELQDGLFADETFDVITLSQVIEHLPDPSATIRIIQKILKKDGLLIIGLPNWGCYDRKVFGPDWTPLEIPRHLYHFEPFTIQKLLEKYDFKIQEIRAKGFFLYGFKNLFTRKEQRSITKFYLLLRLSLIKCAKMLFSEKRKEKFGVLFSVYCKK